MSEAGEVPCLLVDNSGDRPVLFIEGEEVRGGKQNRVLLQFDPGAGRGRTRIPVACTELRRWEYGNRQFTAGSHCPPSLRYFLKEGNARSSVADMDRRSAGSTPASASGPGRRTCPTRWRRTARRSQDLRGSLPYVEGASGIAVAIGGKVVGMDIFDKPATCKAVWGRVVGEPCSSMPWNLRHGTPGDGSDISVKLYKVKDVRWQKVSRSSAWARRIGPGRR